MGKRKPTIAICYDFDGTLSPGNMQEYDFFPQLDIKPRNFWKEAKKRAKEQQGDSILSYMCLMIEKAVASGRVKITRKAFGDYGKQVKLFDGVVDWFKRVNEYGREKGASIEHYIISSGIREMIEGTPIAREFKKIYASAFWYDQHDVAKWPAQALNFTTKTQFLFRVNKGCLNEWDDVEVNKYVSERKRSIPFKRMIYIGDGTTDIPCMKLVKVQGGYSIAVYKPSTRGAKADAEKLLKENRVNFVLPADYTEGSPLDRKVKALIDMMVAEFIVEKRVYQRRRKAAVRTKQQQENRPDDVSEVSQV
ncbi:MAG: haloacid dehalogenase-like hydrolase [Deltaproteobacteria bacterium]|nr:MAG: haloacid dehalogenase-like hydrolase [Deltaproteobacteria bacterium]